MASSLFGMNDPCVRRTGLNFPFLRPGTLSVVMLALLSAFPPVSIGDFAPLFVASTSTQAPSAESWALEARNFLLTGDYLQALSPAQRALKQQEADFGLDHPKVSAALNTLGLVYFQLAKLDLAQSAHERALNIREVAIGTASPEVAESVTHLARVWISKGEYAKAERMLERALAIREAVFGQRHVLVAETLMYLAMVQGLQMHLSEALATQSGRSRFLMRIPKLLPSNILWPSPVMA